MPGGEYLNLAHFQNPVALGQIGDPNMMVASPSRYDSGFVIPDYDPSNPNYQYEVLDRLKAENQGFGMELATAGANLIPNIALSMVETAGYLFDLEDWSNMIQGNAANYGNALTEWASANKNQFGDVYRKSPEAGFDITDSAWWVSNGASLVESLVAYGLTGYGVGNTFMKGATSLSKVLGAYGKAKTGINLSAQLGTSGVLAYTEGAMTGAQVYKDTYPDAYNSKLEELLEKGTQQYGEGRLTEEYQKYAETAASQFAKQVAGEAATKAVRINTGINTFLNIPETGVLFRSMSTSRYLDDALKLERGELAKDAVERIKSFNVNKHLTRQAVTHKVKETGSEMLEEMVNVYAEQQGKNVGREATGQDVMTLGDMLADDDIWAAGFWGAIGGSMNGFVMGQMPKWVTQEDGTKKRTTVGAYNKKEISDKYKEQLTDLTDRLTEFINAKDDLIKASKSGDERAYKEAADKVFSYNSFNSVIKGTEEQLLNDFRNILSLTPEEATQQGFASDYKQRASEKIQSIRENTEEWNKIQDRYASQDLDQAGFPETIFQQHINVQNNRKIIQENTLELAKLESEIAQANNLRGTDVTRTSFNDIISSIKAVENSFELATIDLENILNLDKFDSRTQKRIIAKLSNMYGNIANARTQIEEHLNELKEKRADLINGLEIQKANYYSFIDPDNEMSDAEKETRYASTIAQNTADIDALADGKQVLESNKKILASQEDELRVLKSKEGLERFKQLKKEKMAEREAIDAKAAAKAEAEAAAKAEAAKVEAIKTKKKEAPETVTVEEEEFVEAVTPVESFEEGSYTGEGSTPKELEKQYEDISKVANNSDVEGEIIDSSGKVISVGDRLIEGSNKLAYASTVEYVEEDGEIKHVSLKLNPETNPDLLTDKYAPGTKLKIRRLTAGEFKPFVTAKDLNFIDELGRKILVANKGETVTFEMLSHPYMQPIGIFNEAGEYQAMLHAANYITSDRIVPANVAADLQALINIRAAVTDKFQDITINSKSNGKLNQLTNFHRLSELIDQPVEFAIATSTIQLNSSKTTPVENLANKKGFKVGQVYAITVMPDGRKLAIPVKTTKVKESPEVLSELMAALDTFLKGGSRGDLQNVFGKYLHSVFSSDKLTKSDNAFDEDPNGKDRIYIDFTSSNVDGIIFGRAGFSKKFISGNSPVDSIEALKKELGSLIQESYVNINFEALKDPDFVKYFVKSNVRFYPLPNGKVTVFDNPVIGFDTSTLLNATAPAAKKDSTTDTVGFEALGNIGNQGLAIMEDDILKKGKHVIGNIPKATPEQRQKIDSDIEQLKTKYPEKSITSKIEGNNLIVEVTPTVTPTTQVQTIEDIKNDIAELRAREQAEYDAMADPNDTAAKDKIYQEYDKLITPLIDEAKADIKKRRDERLNNLPNQENPLNTPEENLELLNNIKNSIIEKYDAEMADLEKPQPTTQLAATDIVTDVGETTIYYGDYTIYKGEDGTYDVQHNEGDGIVGEYLSTKEEAIAAADRHKKQLENKPTVELKSANGATFTIRLDEDDDLSITTTEDLGIKPGVEELFDSNPELANAVYEALGVEVKNFKLIPNNEKHPEDANTYDVIYNNEKIGVVALFEGKNKIIKGVKLDEKFRNKGLGKKLYKFLNLQANLQGGVLFSDPEQQSADARRLWGSLIKEGVVNRATADEQSLKFNIDYKQQAQQLYSQYLDTIFPDSKVKDIVYHTNTRGRIESFNSERGLFVTPTWELAKTYKPGLNGKRFQLVIDSKNIDKVSEETIMEGKKESGDTLMYSEPDYTEYVVFEPEQIHILGSKQDIDGFKEFTKSGKQIEKYVSLQDKVNTLIQEGKATKFCK